MIASLCKLFFLETRSVVPRLDTFHPFEDLRDAYERKSLLRGFSSSIGDIAETRSYESMNEDACLSALRALAPDIVLVFGTGKLSMSVIEVASAACLNLHGGNPEEYRGLDTHLWAVYHSDFENLVTTLHHVDAGLDTGNIVFQSQLELEKNTRLHELRAKNTNVCLNLTLLALDSLQSIGWLPSRKQLSRGRYYSSMPAALKEECVRKFQSFVTQL